MTDSIEVEDSFIWKIENYSFCFDKLGETLESPIFLSNNLNGSKWFLTFRLFEETGRNYFSCFLNRCKEDLCDEKILISFTIEAINGKGANIITQKKTGVTFYQGSMSGWDKFNKSNKVGFRINDCVSCQNLNWDKDVLTIRCTIKRNLNRSESVALSEIGIKKCSFQWKIKFSDCVAASQTKNFSLSETPQYEMSVRAPDDVIDIKIKRADEYSSSPHYLHGQIILLNQEENGEISSKNAKHLFDLEDGSAMWSFPSFITKEQLGRSLKNDIFSLLCRFSALNGEKSTEISSSAPYFRINCNNVLSLHEDLSNLFTRSKHSDVEFRSGSMTFSVHKSVLTARSPVFSAMFDQDMTEKQSGIVDISDTDPETLQSFLKFVYSGTVVMKDYENASKLLMLAEKYQMPSLKETCSIFLMSVISFANLFHILELADMLNLKQLKKCALDYFAEHMKEILVLPQWKKFSANNVELSMEIISYVAENFEISTKKN